MDYSYLKLPPIPKEEFRTSNNVEFKTKAVLNENASPSVDIGYKDLKEALSMVLTQELANWALVYGKEKNVG